MEVLLYICTITLIHKNMKIEGYENYEVRPNGEVVNTKTGKVLKPLKNTGGYLRVDLWKNGKKKRFYIHRLIAQAFIANPDNLPCVNHKDEDKTNNNMENLEWCTYEYNLNYGTRIERVAKANINGKRSKTVLQLMKDGSFVRVWSSVSEVERQLHFSKSHISECCRGELQSAYGYKWCYAYN